MLVGLLKAEILPLTLRVRLTRERVRVEKAVKETYLCSLLGKSKEAEIKRINKELANIRSKFKGKCVGALL